MNNRDRLCGLLLVYNKLNNLIDQTEFAESFNIVGFVERTRLAELYCNVHLLCVPSRSEPLANVVLESLVCGTPVVASNVGGNSSMVTHGLNGWLVEPNSAENLAIVLENLARHPEQLQSVAKNCVDSIEKRFSWEVVGERLAHNISGILHGSAS